MGSDKKKEKSARQSARRVVWSPQKKQAQFMERGEYEALYGGAAGGGKSDALLVEALRQVNTVQPSGQYAIRFPVRR